MKKVREQEVPNGYCDFREEELLPLEEEAKKKILIAELDEFGHAGDLPKGVRKINIIV